jgi:hypothetical protein
MTLAAGSRLGPYEILGQIGAGILLPPLPAGEGWGEGCSDMKSCNVSSLRHNAPLTPPSPPNGGRGVVVA